MASRRQNRNTEPKDTTRGDGRPSPRKGRRALLILVLAVALLTIAGITRDRDDHDGDQAWNEDEIYFRIQPVDALILPGEPTDAVQTVAMAMYHDEEYETAYEVVRYDGESDRPVWRSMRIPRGDRAQLRNAGRQVIASVDRTLYAFDLATGAELWHTELSDTVPQDCTSCLAIVDGNVIARPLDAVLHSIDATSGAVRWTRRLEDVNGTVRAVGRFLLVTDGAAPNTHTVEVDPASGSVRHDIPASCPSSTSTPEVDPAVGDEPAPPFQATTSAAPMGPAGVVVTSPTEPDVAYLGFGTWPACWQAWDLSSGTLRWSSTLPDESLDDGVATAVSGPDLLYSTRHSTLGVVDAATGAVTALTPEPEQVFTPLTSAGDVVAGVRISSRGTPQTTVVGLDRRTGAAVWTVELGTTTPIAGSVVAAHVGADDTLREGDVAFDVGVVDGKLAVITVSSEGDGTAQVIEPADGSRTELETWSAWGGTPPFVVRSEGWAGPTVVLLLDEGLFAIDALEARRNWTS